MHQNSARVADQIFGFVVKLFGNATKVHMWVNVMVVITHIVGLAVNSFRRIIYFRDASQSPPEKWSDWDVLRTRTTLPKSSWRGNI
jgi:hypothetical protein